MDQLIIGEGSLDVHQVAKVIEKSKSFGSLLEKWKLFAENIGVSDVVLKGVQHKLSAGTLQLEEIPRELLKIWKASKGSNATLTVLLNALVDCGLKDVAESLQARFYPQPVPKPRKKLLEEVPLFVFNDKLFTMKELLGENTSSYMFQHILHKLKEKSPTKPIHLIKQQFSLPELPKYYISRTLLYRTELDKNIFSAHSIRDHIFLVKGAGKEELAAANGFQFIETSGNQIHDLTVRFILLESEDDFERICRLTTKPVHLVEYRNETYFWIKSSKMLKKIQEFLKPDGIKYTEAEMVTRIAFLPFPYAISIADSPGMGKTYVSTKFAQTIKQISTSNCNNNNVLVLFIIFHDFTQKIGNKIDSGLNALRAIIAYVSTNKITNWILEEMLTSDTYQLYLILDGYDEVMPDKRELANAFLKHIQRRQNIKMIVTTRPHLRLRLDGYFNRVSLEFQPFSPSNQIDFLTRYWILEHGAADTNNLLAFAHQCLTTLEKKMDDTERNIAGIPLQCMILAEVYAEDAKRASKLKTLAEDAVKPISFFAMYILLIDLKFSRLAVNLPPESNLIQKYKDAHVHDSISLLFPEWLEKFQVHLNPRKDINESTIFSIGLIEKNPFSNSPRFVHRTFAECLLAGFIVRNLNRYSTCLEFLYTKIFGYNGVLKTERASKPTLNLYELRHPVIGYFIEMHLRDLFKNNKFNKNNLTMSTKLNPNDVCLAAVVCCCLELENCFDLTTQVLHNCNIRKRLDLRDHYFKVLPHHIVRNTTNVLFVKKVLNFTKQEFGVKLSFHASQLVDQTIADCTPLQIALTQGKFNIVMFLLKEYKEDVLSMKYLLHACVRLSAKNSDSVIEEKLCIINSLIDLNPRWLEEERGLMKPLLESQVHIKIIQRLIKLGADINTWSKAYGTILHSGGDEETYLDLVRWVLRNGFKLINHSNLRKQTPLIRAIERFSTVDVEVLRMFCEAGADFNAQDGKGKSVLFYAIENSKSPNFVEQILELGANPNVKDKMNENAAHLVLTCYKHSPRMALSMLKSLEARGFTGFKEKDQENCTPLVLAEKLGIRDRDLRNFLHGKESFCCSIQ